MSIKTALLLKDVQLLLSTELILLSYNSAVLVLNCGDGSFQVSLLLVNGFLFTNYRELFNHLLLLIVGFVWKTKVLLIQRGVACGEGVVEANWLLHQLHDGSGLLEGLVGLWHHFVGRVDQLVLLSWSDLVLESLLYAANLQLLIVVIWSQIRWFLTRQVQKLLNQNCVSIGRRLEVVLLYCLSLLWTCLLLLV